MNRWPVRCALALGIAGGGCAQTIDVRPGTEPRPEPIPPVVESVEPMPREPGRVEPEPRPQSDASRTIDTDARPASLHGPRSGTHAEPRPIHSRDPMAVTLGSPEPWVELSGRRPVDDFIRAALANNRTVRAAKANVMALKHRIPQVTALEDPVVSNTIFPSDSNGLQTASGFFPWNLLIAQQFPWFGTLQLQGAAAEQDVQVALAELAAAQLDVVEQVKRAYYDLAFNEEAERILVANRAIVENFLEIAEIRYINNLTGQEDLRAAEVALADIDRELITVSRNQESAKADLIALAHLETGSEFVTERSALAIADVPAQLDRLTRLADRSSPDLIGRRAAVVRDRVAVELARKRGKPDVTLGFSYGLISKEDGISSSANGNDNIGMFVGFNLPIYRRKIRAGIREAEARAVADARLLEAERDETHREIRDLLATIEAHQKTLELFRNRILPPAEEALELIQPEYEAGTTGFLTLLSAWREVLQVELQIAQVEAELGKTLASLERAVGTQLRHNPPQAADSPRGASPEAGASRPEVEPPPNPEAPGPFTPSREGAPQAASGLD